MSLEVRCEAKRSTHQGGAGEEEAQGGSELLIVASERVKGLKGERAEELDSTGRESAVGSVVWFVGAVAGASWDPPYSQIVLTN